MDRFLTFYYGHPGEASHLLPGESATHISTPFTGFHINNILVILSVQLFMFALVFLGTLNKQLTICKYTADGQFVGGQGGCYNLVPVYDWIKRCVVSIFIVFFIGESARVPCFSAQ
jgi:1,3-beta-glucan synthase